MLNDLDVTEKRKAEAERIRQKYPDRIPVSLVTCDGVCFTEQLRCVGHLREGRPHRYPHNRQEEISCAIGMQAHVNDLNSTNSTGPGSYSGAIRVRDTETYQARTRESYLHLCG